MSATGVIRVAPTGSKASPNVRYAFNGDRICASQRTDAMCRQKTLRIERLDIYMRPLDHAGPLVCVGCDALSELGRGLRYHGLTQVDQPGL